MTLGGLPPAALLLSLLASAGGAAASEAALRVEYGGCANVVEGPVCLLGEDAHLTLWVRSDSDAPIEIIAGKQQIVAGDGVQVQAGTRFELALSAKTRLVEVRAGRREGDGKRWTLRLAPEVEPEFVMLSRQAAMQGRWDEARRLIEEALRSNGIERRGMAVSLLARMDNRAGDPESAEQGLRLAIDRNLAEGFRFDALRDATMLSYSRLHRTRDFPGASAALDRVAEPWGGPAEGEYFLDYYRGLVAFTSGDSRGALGFLGRARDRAQRMGWERLTLNSESMVAVQLRVLGRGDEARTRLSPWRHRRPADMPSCEFAHVLTNIGWIELLALEAREPASDPTPALEDALELYREHCSAQDRVNGLVNLALARLHAGDLDRAGRHLAAAQEETDAPELRMVLWADDVKARIALSQGRPREAFEAFVALEELASATLSPSAQWRASVGKARALTILGDIEAALDTYAAADRALDDALYRVPFDEGRERLAATRASATAHHLQLLLDTGQSDEAFTLARRSRNRMLQSLRPASTLDENERKRWEAAMARYRTLHDELVSTANLAWLMPADARARLSVARDERERELRALLDTALAGLGPAPETPEAIDNDALTLVFHPLPEGWVAFGHDGSTLWTHRTDCTEAGDPERLALCVLMPFRDVLAGNPGLHILPVGPLRSVDFHALPWDSGVLLDVAPLSYGLDLSGEGTASAGGRALLVADPRGDLVLSQREVESVAAILSSDGGWSLEVLEGGDADSTSVRAQMASAELLHFAGHARFTGAGGWDSELLLADQGALDVADIIALPASPSFVVLSGCETAASAGDSTPESIGLAHAFLTSGTRTALAATRPVEDALAFRLMNRFYREYLPTRDAARALRTTQLALRAQDPDQDWSAFRVIER